MTLPPLEDYVAIDCEMVQVRSAQALAKVGIVDYTGKILLESYVFVHPKNVIDWRSDKSGIRPGDLDRAPTFESIQPVIKAVLKDKIVIGHALFNDLSAIQHRHSYEQTRDTALYYPLRQLVGVEIEGLYPSLKSLARVVLGREIQLDVDLGGDGGGSGNGASGLGKGGDKSGRGKGKGHCPVEDARATMAIFMTVREEYEMGLAKGEEVISGLPPSFEKWYW